MSFEINQNMSINITVKYFYYDERKSIVYWAEELSAYCSANTAGCIEDVPTIDYKALWIPIPHETAVQLRWVKEEPPLPDDVRAYLEMRK